MIFRLSVKLKVTAALVVVTFFCFGQNPLFIPPTLSGTTFNLNVIQDSTEFFTGHKTPTYGVNGNILGPTLVLNKGDVVTLNVTNNLNTTTTMHWHGLHVPAMADGGPHQVIAPGTTWSPSFEVKNDAATFWYHPHGQNKTDLQVTKGLAGLIIVKDSVEDALVIPRTYGVDDFPLIVQTKCFDVLYQTAIATMFDTVPMINATINPFLNAPSQVIRLRLLNGSSDRSYLFGFSNNMNFYQIATDGGLIEAPLMLNRLRLSPGERAEILLNLDGMSGQTINLMNYGSALPNGIIGAQSVGNGMAQIPDYDLNPLNGADFSLLQINIGAQTANPISTIPLLLVPYNPWNTANTNRTRTITFAPVNMGMQQMVEGPFAMNGHQFDMMVVNDTTYLNHVEIWTLTNQTLVAHPFHIHDVQFYLTSVNGNPPPFSETGKKDVVLVMPQQTVSFITKFEDYSDTIPYMYHCHLLHHEDDGMMGSFVVLDSTLLSASDIAVDFPVSVYPNPVTGNKVTINTGLSSNEIIHFRFSNLLGERIYEGEFNAPDKEISIDKKLFVPGLYILELRTKNSKTHTRITIQN